VPIPDTLKGSIPFAFVVTAPAYETEREVNDEELLKEVNTLVRKQVGGIAVLGGIIRAKSGGEAIIPRTRSGKTLRRVLRELLENTVYSEVKREVSIPVTVEDRAVIKAARRRVKGYFKGVGRGRYRAVEGRVVVGKAKL